jgi:O-antigen ligase
MTSETAGTRPHVVMPAASSGRTPGVFAFHVLLATTLVLYVYRFAVAGVNMSAFRLLLLGWMAWFALDLVRGRVIVRRCVPLLVIGAGLVVVNAIDFLTLSGYPALRRDIANHLLNVVFAGLIAVYASGQPRRASLLHAFVLSSLVTSAVTLYAALFDRLPFEDLIRQLGSELGRNLAYINDDLVFVRATSTFYDPNFYGVYSMLVIVAILYLWRFERPSRYLAVMLPLNLVCLSLTLSRTALVGLLAALAVVALIDRRSWRFAAGIAVSSVVLLYGATAVQSHAGSAALVQQVSDLWERLTPDDEQEVAAGPGAGTIQDGAGVVAAGSAKTVGVSADAVQERVVNARSLADRMNYIRHGVAVFRGSPIWGQGSAALVGQSQWSSAHVSYLTLLARYGIAGTMVYMVFLLWPLVVLWRRVAPPGDRFFVTVALCALAVVYLSYDILLAFEVQYLVFGVAYAAALDVRERRGRLA